MKGKTTLYILNDFEGNWYRLGSLDKEFQGCVSSYYRSAYIMALQDVC